ncbi:MAG: Pr6Pr family membrane protein [Steroidobacteraceae bacterium]|jgi:hypothetical protein
MTLARKGVFAISLAMIAWASVCLQCFLSLQLAAQKGLSVGSGLEIFFSYFTVLTNVLICVSLTVSLMRPLSALGRWFSGPTVVAGIATSIAFVGLSYHFLLSKAWNPQGAQRLADVLLHYGIPILYVLYWWLDHSKMTLRWVHPLFWSLYPTVYLVYTLIRGSILGNYPYPFIDAGDLGYGRTLLNSFGLLMVFLALGFSIVALGRARLRMGNATGLQ